MIRAIDVSRYQGRISWPRVRHAGIAAAWIKLTEGAEWTDPLGAANGAQATDAGLPWGGYLFFREGDVGAQVAHFLTVLRAIDGAPLLPPLLDVERPDPSGHRDLGARALEALVLLEEATGCTPWLYCSPAFARAQGFADVPELARFPLLVADWRLVTHREPEVPAPWTDYAGRQTGSGRVDGVGVDVDLDVLRVLP